MREKVGEAVKGKKLDVGDLNGTGVAALGIYFPSFPLKYLGRQRELKAHRADTRD